MKFEQFFVQTLYSKIDISHKKMDQLVGFLLHPPLSEIGKKRYIKYIIRYIYVKCMEVVKCSLPCDGKV